MKLSKYFYMREFLYSEIANINGLQNIPDDPDLAVANGRAFCSALLDPLEETFGRVALRSGYRSAALNRFGNENKLNCARNLTFSHGASYLICCSERFPTPILPHLAVEYAVAPPQAPPAPS